MEGICHTLFCLLHCRQVGGFVHLWLYACVTLCCGCVGRQKAMKRLRVPPLGEQQSPWTTFKVGLFLGAFVVLVAAVILTGEPVRRSRK